MKILYHHRTTASDGSAVHIDGLSSALRGLGAEVVMIEPPTTRRGAAGVNSSSSTSLRQMLPRWLHELLELIYNLPEWLSLQAAIARHRPDVIYERNNLYLLSGIIAARCSRTPIIEEVNSPLFIERSRHGGIALGSLARCSERWVWSRADAVVTVSQVLADIVASIRGDGGSIEVMPNGVDRTLFAPDRIDREAKHKLHLEGKTVLGFTGFVRDWNGLEQVVDLLPRLRPEVVLLIVGDGPARSSLERRARASGVASRVIFTGVVARDAIACLVSAFDIALQPAANPYASPLKLFEYLALGRVVLAPDQPNLREVLTHGANAWLFDPNEPGAMQRAIERLLNDVDARQRLALAALNTIHERELTWERNAERVLELARQLSGCTLGRVTAGQASIERRSAPALEVSLSTMHLTNPRLLVFSSIFPSAAQPNAGLFIRERMFRVGKHLPIVVVAPQAWFPGQALIRRFRPHFRAMAPAREVMEGIVVHRPRFFCIPGVLKWTDGLFMALSSFFAVRRIARSYHANIIDAHFGYPDGYAAVLLGRWLQLPVMLTLRGKEARQARTDVAAALKWAITGADQLITVSAALQALAIEQGANPARVQVIGNGVDLSKFTAVPRQDSRRQFGLPADAEVLVSVGTLVERKGFHRVIECLPGLLAGHPSLHMLVVGGAGPEGDMGGKLKGMVRTLGLDDRVHFLGPLTHDRLNVALSAADVFVLATSYEGWANVFLEAMACGLPVVTTDVGGNAQVVNNHSLGRIVPFGDTSRLQQAIGEALRTRWDRESIRAYAESNSWDQRIQPLIDSYHQLLSRGRKEKHGQARAEIGHAG